MTPVKRTELNTPLFRDRLAELLKAQELTASDLARGLYGETTDKRGQNVARNRDAVSRWLLGKNVPSAMNMTRIADYLDVPVHDLAPVELGERTAVGASKILAYMVSDTPLLMRVQIDTVLPVADALALLTQLKEVTLDVSGPDDRQGSSKAAP